MSMNWKNRFILQANRHMRSIYFRVILVGYGIILSMIYDDIFPGYVYMIFFLLYLVVQARLFGTISKVIALLRSVFDLAIIAFSLYGKPLDNITTISMLFIPIANAINHTGKNMGSKMYILLLFIVYLFLAYANGSTILTKNIFYVVLPFIAFFLIHLNTVKNWVVTSQNSELQDAIDDYYNHGTKHEEVYKRIIDVCAKYNLSCNAIYCFITHDSYKSLYIVNASQFVYTYNVELKEKQIEQLSNDKIDLNADITIEDRKIGSNLLIPVNKKSFRNNEDNSEYLFVVTFLNDSERFKWITLALESPLKRFAKLLYTERIMKKRRREYNEQIKEKGRFVDSAINTMHFIKNRLTSVQTLTDIVNDADFTGDNQTINSLAKETAKRSQIDIDSIRNKARYLLNKDNNPFHYQKIEMVKPRKVFSILRTVWENSFNHRNLLVDNVEFLENENLTVQTNMEGLEILFSDIIGNMFKYQNSYSACKVSCSTDILKICFLNDFFEISIVKELINSYNENSKEEITKRKTYGVSNIKSFVSDTNLDLVAFTRVEDDKTLFCLEITFKLYQNENFDNRE